ncbi:MAG: Uncharacterized protein G01um101413_68 [Parcubacteria group bacterium Gr01-1014_13]|nr:MAG: Uncharacterized protein G01um101413_68 [Parcubacteria group bacterium Gr01-1014_13]
MSLRARIFIIISIVVFLILGISIFLIVRNKNKNAQPQTGEPNTTVNSNGQPNDGTTVGAQAPAGLPAKTATPLEAEKNSVSQLAKFFLERYGTYSSDNDFQNIKEVEVFVTAALWSKISAPMNSKTTTNGFVGMTTKVISMELTDWSDTAATVELKTTRTEEKNGVVSTRYQNATVEMVKENGVWLADKLVWN